MKPRKHAALIHAYADGATIQVRNKDFGSCDCGPEWRDVKCPTWYDYAVYRIKPKEYPKTTLTKATLLVERCIDGTLIQVDSTNVANAAIEEFITSGEMLKYVLDPANGILFAEEV